MAFLEKRGGLVPVHVFLFPVFSLEPFPPPQSGAKNWKTNSRYDSGSFFMAIFGGSTPLSKEIAWNRRSQKPQKRSVFKILAVDQKALVS